MKNFTSSRFCLLALATSSLTACSDFPKAWSHSEIEDIASDVAYDVAAEQAQIIDDNGSAGNNLAEEVASLERLVEAQGRVIEAQSRQIDALNNAMTDSEQNVAGFVEHFNKHTH